MTLQEAHLLTITLQDVLFLIRVHVGGLSGISVAASAPAITGRFCIDPFNNNGVGVHSQIGAFYTTTVTGTPNPYAAYGSNSTRPTTTAGTFAASRSSSIYGASNTIRPLSYQTKFMIRF